MKRLIGIFIALIMAAAILPVSAETDGAEQTTEYEVLSALGITIDGFEPDKEVTRGQAAKVIADIAGITPAGEESTGFFDVTASHEFAASIRGVSDAGIMRGTENGLFEPDRAITYAELARTILVMMNYDVYAEAKGGYITGYMNAADRLKLSKGTGGLAFDTPLDGKAFAKVLYNALDEEVLQVSSFGENVEYETVEGETLAYKYLSVKKGEGRVNATSKTAITGSKVSEGKIRIDDEIVSESSCSGAKWLGYTVEYWVRVYDDDDTPELVYIAPNGDETTLTVRGYDIVSIKGSKLTYKDGNDEDDINMSEDMVCIYNGTVIDYTADDLQPNDGSVEFIINDSNRAEIAIVRDYSYGAVRSVTSSGSKIVFEDMSSIRLDDYDDWQLVKNGRSITLIELAAGDVLNILESRDGSTIYAEVSGSKVSGKISGILEDNGKNIVYFDGAEGYSIISPSYTAFAEEIRLGFEGEWYTNILGDIFAAIKVKSGSMEYGYMISYNLLIEPEDTIKIKLFTVDGSFVSVYSNDRVVLVGSEDGSSRKITGKELYEYLTGSDMQPQLVKYALDEEGYLKRIQFAKKNYDRAEGKTIRPVGSYGTGAFTLDYTADGGSTGFFQIGIFDCTYLVDPSAPIFRIPQDKSEEKAYSVIARADLTRRLYYDAELYDIDENSEAQACVINIASASANYNWTTLRIALVDKNIEEFVEEEGIAARALSIYQDGKALKIYSDDSDMVTQTSVQSRYHNVSIKDLKPGDVIAYSADSSNMIKNFELLYSYAREDGSYFAYSNEIGIPTKTDYSAELYLGYGIVKAATGNGLVVNAHGDGRDETWNHYFPLEAKLTRTYLFDTETNKWQTVPYATVKEGDRAVIRMQGYGLWEILIYE